MKKKSEKERIKRLFMDKASVRIDLGSGENKQPGCIGVDFRKLPGVDIIWDLNLFPWKPIPDGIADVVYSSHLLEHISPAPADPRLAGLVDLLLEKGLVTQKEINASVGGYRFLGGFLKFMDETWRILKRREQLISPLPYAGSAGFWWDPTHKNPVRHESWTYFDPLAKDGGGNLYNFYTIYRPKPWKIVKCFYDPNGNMEVCLEKRLIDKSYNVSKDNGMSIE